MFRGGLIIRQVGFHGGVCKLMLPMMLRNKVIWRSKTITLSAKLSTLHGLTNTENLSKADTLGLMFLSTLDKYPL